MTAMAGVHDSSRRRSSALSMLAVWLALQQQPILASTTRNNSGDRRSARHSSSLSSDASSSASSSWSYEQDYSFSSDTSSRRYRPLSASTDDDNEDDEEDDFEERILSALDPSRTKPSTTTTIAAHSDDNENDNDNDSHYDDYDWEDRFNRQTHSYDEDRRRISEDRQSKRQPRQRQTNNDNTKSRITSTTGSHARPGVILKENTFANRLASVAEKFGVSSTAGGGTKPPKKKNYASKNSGPTLGSTTSTSMCPKINATPASALSQQDPLEQQQQRTSTATLSSQVGLVATTSSTNHEASASASHSAVSKAISPGSYPSSTSAMAGDGGAQAKARSTDTNAEMPQHQSFRQSIFSRQQRPHQQASRPNKNAKQKTAQKQQQQQQQQQKPATAPIPNSSITPWVRKFVLSRPADGLLPVPRDYLADNFNLVRLPPVVEHLAAKKQTELEQESPNLEQQQQHQSNNAKATQQQDQEPLKNHPYALYRQALDLILSQKESDKKPTPVVQYAAEVLYGLIHARFIVSTRGLESMRQILILHASNHYNSRQHLFGRCPRLDCGSMPLLPSGLSDDYDLDSGSHNPESRAKRYCCSCRETFHCWDSKVDGSAWGTSACHLLLMLYGKENLFPSHFTVPYKKESGGSLLDKSGTESRTTKEDASVDYGHIFGFPVHPSVTLS